MKQPSKIKIDDFKHEYKKAGFFRRTYERHAGRLAIKMAAFKAKMENNQVTFKMISHCMRFINGVAITIFILLLMFFVYLFLYPIDENSVEYLRFIEYQNAQMQNKQ